MNRPLPATIPEYLQQLRAALAGADSALVQDALYDAEDHLRSEWAEHPELDERTLLAGVAGSYGAPAEVAAIYRDIEATVVRALHTPRPAPPRSVAGAVFGVLADPRAYGSLLYLLLTLATGTFYFTWAVTGLSLTVGLAILIIGIPFAILFFASVRGLALVEGRLIEALLGERMPRRPPYAERDRPLMQRIGEMFTDPRSWSTMLYLMLMLPLGTLYSAAVIIALALSFGLMFLPFAQSIWGASIWWWGEPVLLPLWTAPVTILGGLFLLLLTLHAAKGVGQLHAGLAKHLLVRSTP